MKRWLSLRLKRSCGFSSMTMTTSPGVTPGAWSLSPRKVIVWPPFMPLSMCTSSIFFSETTFLPLHVLQRSLLLMISPVPEHSSHACWICWIIGPIWRIMMRMPRPLQEAHSRTAPSLPPLPLHFAQMTLRVSASFVILPLYRSSSETVTRCTRSFVLRGPCGLPPPPKNPPPPNSCEKRSYRSRKPISPGSQIYDRISTHLWVHAAHSARLAQTGLSSCIVDASLLWVRQDFVAAREPVKLRFPPHY